MNKLIRLQRRLHPVLALVALTLVSGTVSAEAYTVKLQNLTRGQHFTPPIFIVHNPSFSLFELGNPASASLIKLAEEGETADVVTSVTETNGSETVVNGATAKAGGPVAPGAETEVCVDTGTNAAFVHLSLAGMLLPTNDGFVAINAQLVPSTGGTWLLNAYDAGSEGNSELDPDIPGPMFLVGDFALGASGTGTGLPAETESENVVHVHRGVIGDTDATGGISDINSAVSRWLNPVARVTVTVAAGACATGS
ncbi:MAG: spondin domain-containing protein [Gammaproteobacteria bacterium]|nr:spondin domain-containing protein [Pseudomonadota bacterium]MCH9663312.1 spondin domain-containing protein [Gammaproteobacteria bacterium]